MKCFSSRFAWVAAAGLTVLALAQTPVQAQFRRPLPPRVVPPVVVTPRRPIVVPPVTGFVNSNPYVLPGLTLNQLATYNVLSQSGTLPPWMYGYNPYRPFFYTPYPTLVYPTFGYPTYLYPSVPVGVPYSPFNFNNPYFATFGFGL
jgi:hypothetical protein